MYIMSYVIGNNLVVFIMIDKFIGAICNENRARLNGLYKGILVFNLCSFKERRGLTCAEPFSCVLTHRSSSAIMRNFFLFNGTFRMAHLASGWFCLSADVFIECSCPDYSNCPKCKENCPPPK